MTRGEKVKRFLIGGSLLIGGILSLVVRGSNWLQYAVGGGLVFFGLVLMSERSSKPAGLFTFVIGSLFLAEQLLPKYLGMSFPSWTLTFAGILSLGGGVYLTYDSYKKINSY